jgi:serine phosphatase RsbU (regulator of sigma subunit)
MRAVGLVIFSFICFGTLRAQSQKNRAKSLDSLYAVITSDSAEDTSRVKAAASLIRNIYKRDPDSAFRMAQTWFPLANKFKLKKPLGIIYWCQGCYYTMRGKTDSALIMHLRSLKIREELDDIYGMLDSYSGLAQAQSLLKQYDKALESYQKGIEQGRRKNDKGAEATLLSNMGGVYKEMGKPEMGLKVLRTSLALKKESGMVDSYNLGLMNYSMMNYLVNNFRTGDSSLKICTEYFSKTGNKEGMFVAKTTLAGSYNRQGRFAEAEKIFQSVMDEVKNSPDAERRRRAFKGIHESYVGLGKYKEAYEYFRAFQDINDTIVKAANMKNLQELETKYGTEKKEKEIELLNKDKTLKDTELDKRKNMIIFFALMLVLFAVLSIVVIRNNVQRKKSNQLLMKLNQEITQQKNEVEHQKNLVHEKNTEITDSIRYAKRLQNAILPPLKYISDRLPGTFVLYKPKDIVAGDFYWAEERDGWVFVAAADCTGHGVPGSLVSVVCSNALNRTVNEFGITDPGKILDRTTELVLETFARSGEEIRDGMDISLCAIDKKTKKVLWAGANNPLVYFKGGDMLEITANKQPIGKHEHFKPFLTHEINLQTGDILYLFTDGFADQFGGPKGKKFKYQRFIKILVDNCKQETAYIQKELMNAFEEWQGEFEQVDDVTVIGIRL